MSTEDRSPERLQQDALPSHPTHEPSNSNVKVVIVFACLLFLGSVSILTGVKLLLHYFTINQARVEVPLSPLAEPHPLPPLPRLQVVPG